VCLAVLAAGAGLLRAAIRNSEHAEAMAAGSVAKDASEVDV
jgi:hypothetical protein